MRRKAFAALLFLAFLACAPEAGVVEMAVLQWNPETGVYELETATITTLDDVTALRGEAATPIGSAEIVVDGGRLAGVTTERQFRKAILEDPGGRVEAQYVEQDGVLYPADFHSLNLATAYYNFERSRLYALERGMEPASLRGIDFYYFPVLDIQGAAAGSGVDNAAWFPALRSFLLLPFDQLQEIPLAMNQGVVAHEYGHGLFHAEVHGDAWQPAYLSRWCPGDLCLDSRGPRMLDIVEEGFADAWAVGVTGDPRFTHHSLSFLGDERDPSRFLASRHCYSQAAFEQNLVSLADFAPADQARYWNSRKYEIGAVLAATLYRAGCGADGCTAADDWARYDRVMDALFSSYRRSGPTSLAAVIASDPSGARFGNFATLARALVDAAPDPDTRKALCAAWMDRLAITPDELGGSCDDAISNGECG